MTITLKLKPEVEARAIEQAAAEGIAVERFLALVIEKQLNGETKKKQTARAKAEQWQAWVDSHAHLKDVPPADDSRESIYREREDAQL